MVSVESDRLRDGYMCWMTWFDLVEAGGGAFSMIQLDYDKIHGGIADELESFGFEILQTSSVDEDLQVIPNVL